MSLGAKSPWLRTSPRHMPSWRRGVVCAWSTSWGVTALSSFLPSPYLPSPCCGPGTVPGDGDVRMNKIRVLPQGAESSKGEELISKYITDQCGRSRDINMPRSWDHMTMVKSRQSPSSSPGWKWKMEASMQVFPTCLVWPESFKRQVSGGETLNGDIIQCRSVLEAQFRLYGQPEALDKTQVKTSLVCWVLGRKWEKSGEADRMALLAGTSF